MFFSRVWIDPNRRGARRLLASPQRIHAVIAGATSQPGVRQRPLWRLDSGASGLQLLVVSEHEPDFTSLLEQCDVPSEDGWQTTSYDPFLTALDEGQTWRFRIAANPVRNIREVTDPAALSRGKRVPIVGVQGLQEWLLSRASSLGVEFADGGCTVTERQADTFSRKVTAETKPGGSRQRVSISRVQYDGLLTVTDVTALRGRLTKGVGSAKAYGCGLMTLAQPR